MGDLTNNLSRWEFACRCGCGFNTVDVELVDVLQDVCNNFECRVFISSGCRCLDHNEEIGGTDASQHTRARAADCSFSGVSSSKIYEYLDDKYSDSLGLGLYSTFTHIDTRTGKARWGSAI